MQISELDSADWDELRIRLLVSLSRACHAHDTTSSMQKSIFDEQLLVDSALLDDD